MRLTIFVLLLMTSLNSYAYLDPGTGSYILQILFGAVAGGLLIIKTYWGNIKMYFSAKAKLKTNNKKEKI